MMRKTVEEIATLIGGEVVGDGQVVISGICGIKEAKEGDLTFVANSRYLNLMDETKASAIITSREVKVAPKPIIRTDNPSLAFAKMVSLVSPDFAKHPQGIHSTAIISDKVKLGKGIAIGAYAVIEDNVEIGDGTIIYPSVYIGRHTKVGKETLIYPQVTIRERIDIGSRVIIHSGTIIGSDGFGFVTVDGAHLKIPQIGTVTIEDDVEIGANVTIDRARFGKTVIGRGTKIDNLVQVAHNVVVGENCILVAQVGISGSTTIGKNVTLAGQAGVVGHVEIGNNTVVAARAGVTKSVAPNTCVSGFPAKPHQLAKRIYAFTQRLPNLFKLVSNLEDKIKKVEEKLGITKDDKS